LIVAFAAAQLVIAMKIRIEFIGIVIAPK